MHKHSDGVLVGFNFEGFTFVIVAIVPFSQFKDLEGLARILKEPKLGAFKWSCSGDLMILGILESKGSPHISISSQVLKFKQ